MNLKNFFSKKPLILAPMAGVTDFAFRKLANEYGADLTITEMVSAKAISMNNLKTIDLLYTVPSEKPVCVQLFGHEPNALKKACQDPRLAKFDIIDFNCGCPAPKIVRNGDGCALMNNIEKARECINTLVKYSNKPVSVKFRKGMKGVENYIQFAKMCEECGVSFITIHPRTLEQGYSGSADYSAVIELKKILKIPVVLSGDIVDIKSLQKAKATGADGLMIGRATIGSPWIFNIFKEKNKIPDALAIAKKHLNMLIKHYGNEKFVVPYFKKHLAWYTKNIKNANILKKEICSITSLKQLQKTMKLLSNQLGIT